MSLKVTEGWFENG